jgi:hypothetical protein
MRANIIVEERCETAAPQAIRMEGYLEHGLCEIR